MHVSSAALYAVIEGGAIFPCPRNAPVRGGHRHRCTLPPDHASRCLCSCGGEFRGRAMWTEDDPGEVGPQTEPIVVTVRREFAEEVSALAVLVDEGLMEMIHTDGCVCEGTRRLTAACVSDTMTSYPRWTL